MRSLFLILALLLPTIRVYAQAKIDHDKLDRALDRFELEILYLYIDGNDELTKKKLEDTAYHNRVNAGHLYLGELRKSDGYEESIEQVRSKLKDKYNWKGTTENIENRCKALRKSCDDLKDIEQLKSKLGEFVFGKPSGWDATTIDPKWKTAIERKKPGKLAELINKLITEVEINETVNEQVNVQNSDISFVDSGVENHVIKRGNTSNTGKSALAEKDNRSSWGNFSYSEYFLYLMPILFLLLGILLGWFAGQKSRARSKIKSPPNPEKIENKSQQGGMVKSTSTNSTLTKANEKLQKDNKTLTAENVKLQAENNDLKTQLKPLDNESANIPVQPLEQKDALQRKVVYLSSPSHDGTFSRTYETLSIGNLSFFEFTLNSENTAEFRFIDDAAIQKRALHTFADRISAVADEENWSETNSKAINTETAGTAKRDGEVWRVVTKAKVRYI